MSCKDDRPDGEAMYLFKTVSFQKIPHLIAFETVNLSPTNRDQHLKADTKRLALD